MLNATINRALATIGIAGTLLAGAWVGAAAANAAPAFCSRHEAGDIYIHACATGSGGGSALWVPVRDANGDIVKRLNSDGELKTVHRCKVRCGGGRSGVQTTEPY